MNAQKRTAVVRTPHGSVALRGVVDLKKFRPTTRDAELKVSFMLQRGAVLVAVSERQVKITHAGRTACIDSVGRVHWYV